MYGPDDLLDLFPALHHRRRCGAVVKGLFKRLPDGREEELELLLRRWARATAGEGQVVLRSGEPGIGKSRLTAALLEHLAAEPHTRLRYFCSPQRTDSALFPIIAQLERAARLARDDSPQVNQSVRWAGDVERACDD